MADAFPHVFEPLTLRHRTLRSRITFGAHTANMAEDGLPAERHIGYYRERALGGAGMIVVEPIPIHRTGVLTRGNFRHDDDAVIPAFRRVTDALSRGEPGRRPDPPALSRRAAWRPGQLLCAELVAIRVAVVPRRRRQPRDDRRRDRGVDRGVRGGRGPGQGVGLRRRRDLRRLSRGRGPVLGDLVEPADGRVGRRIRASHALLVRDPAPHPRALWRGLHHRTGGQRRPGLRSIPTRRGAGADRRLARRAPADGLRHVRDGLVLRLRGDHPDLALRAAARRAVRGGTQGGRPARARPGREPYPDAGGGRGGPRRRSRRYGQHRPGPDRRSAPGRQGPGRPRRGRPAVHLLQPAVLGPALARLLDLVPGQPVGRARVRLGRRPIRAGGSRSASAGGGRRAGWAGGGPHRGRARATR